MPLVRKYWILFFLVSLLSGISLKVYFSEITLEQKHVEEIRDGSVIEKTYYTPTPRHVLAQTAANILITFSFALLISLVFIKAIEAADKEKFEGKLLKFQKETAKDAISSTFERLIEKDFFEIIKSDILNAKFQRNDLRWQYDICPPENGKIRMRRTISYELKNISSSEHTEHINVASFTSEHCSTHTVSIKYRIEGDSKFRSLKLEDETDGATLRKKNEDITIPAGKVAEVVVIFTQDFPREYIYETHFLNQGAVGLELIVNLPDGYDFSVNSTVLHSRTEQTLNEANKKTYRIKGAIYRGQGIEFMCYPATDNKKEGGAISA